MNQDRFIIRSLLIFSISAFDENIYPPLKQTSDGTENSAGDDEGELILLKHRMQHLSTRSDHN